ncbi:MAG: homoserine dehydrogenase [Gammaproteobacteria bacterium]
MNAVNIGLIGLGTVGAGTLEILQRNSRDIAGRAGREIRVTQIAVQDLKKQRPVDTGDITLTDDPMQVVNDPDIDIVVELIGGESVARQVVLGAIDNGKHVVTANKALIALHGNHIFEQAQEKGLMVAFEAAVAGGIPIIKSLREGLSANRIQWVAGIINGTCNYILTKMEQEGLDFAEVLRDAQSLGYAEADPTFDIEGIDAAHKLTILASIAFGIPLQFEKVFVEGITAVTVDDIRYAAELGFRIKHLGIARRDPKGIELRVHPALVPKERLIANVNGVMNAALVMSDAVGPTLYYGPGAGAEPTGSAVVADIVDVVRALTSDPNNRVPHLAFQPGALAALPIMQIGQVETAFYLRMSVINRPGVLAAITRIFGDSKISIATILQKGHDAEGGEVSIIMLTQATSGTRMSNAIEQIEALEPVTSKITAIRLENLA